MRGVMFAFTDDDRWVPGIGDPTVVGWVTVVAYFVAVVLCWKCIRQQRASGWSGNRVFWALLFVVMVFLGFNKQLDLQTWLTLFGKHLAQQEGWYEKRRPVQAAFIGAVALSGAAGLLGMKQLAGQMIRPVKVALIGLIFLGCFILIRASSFHHVDQMLGMDFEGIKMNWILELGGISVISAGALLQLRARPPVATLRSGAPPGADAGTPRGL